MSDLDARIRSYADGWSLNEDLPPDFDAAFEQAVAAAPPRRSTVTWAGLGAAACVAALAATVTVVAQHDAARPVGSGAPAGSAAASASAASASAAPSPDDTALAAQRKRAAERSAVTARELELLALAAARQNGDPQARGAAVRTTYARALAAAHAGSGGPDGTVWLIQLTGRFTVENSGPPGTDHTSTGRYLTIIVSAVPPYDQREFGLSDRPADLGELGTVVTLLP